MDKRKSIDKNDASLWRLYISVCPSGKNGNIKVLELRVTILDVKYMLMKRLAFYLAVL